MSVRLKLASSKDNTPHLPLVAWLVHAVALWIWHIPALFEATLYSEAVHTFQHLFIPALRAAVLVGNHPWTTGRDGLRRGRALSVHDFGSQRRAWRTHYSRSGPLAFVNERAGPAQYKPQGVVVSGDGKRVYVATGRGTASR